MSYFPPLVEPANVRAGDTLDFKRELEDFDAGSWTLRYDFVQVGGGGRFNVVAVAEGSAFRVTAAAATTAAWPVGTYAYLGRVTNIADATKVFTVAQSDAFQVLPNLAVTTEGLEHARKVLASIEAVIEGRATRSDQSYKIGQRELAAIPLPELLTFRLAYKAEVERLDRARDVQSGKRSGRMMLQRFPQE